MKNKNELLKSMSVLRKDLYNFITELENFEHNNNIDINDLIIEKYPFDKDLYELYDFSQYSSFKESVSHGEMISYKKMAFYGMNESFSL